jgi:hypothetical protein
MLGATCRLRLPALSLSRPVKFAERAMLSFEVILCGARRAQPAPELTMEELQSKKKH